MKRIQISGLFDARISRRRAVAAGATVAAGTGLAACSGGGGKSFTGKGNKGGNDSQPAGGGTGVSPTPRHQTVVVDQINMTVFDRFNPYIPNGESYQGGVGQIAKEYLWYANLATGKTQAWLGRSWDYSDDYRKFTIHLNPKAHWNDGHPFTSKDVKFTMEMLKKNSTLLGGGPVIDEAKSIATPDEHTVVVELNTRDPRYHYNFICGIVGGFLVAPEHVWSTHDPTQFANNPPVYTGPYKLDRVIADHQLFIWKKDPNYWNKDVMDPAPTYVVYRNSPSPDAEFQQFKQAEADVSANSGMYPLMHSALNGGYKGAIITEMVDPCPSAFFINCDRSKGILADPRMRWVISCLIDREKIGNSIWPIKVPPATYPWPDYPNNKKWEVPSVAAKYPLKYDPKRATRLLDEIGAEAGSDGKRSYRGKRLSFDIITSVSNSEPEFFIGQLLANDLKKVGIDASMKSITGSVYSDRVRKGQFDIRSEWLCGELFDPWQVYNEFDSRYYVPIGKDADVNDSVRLQNSALDDSVKQLGTMNPDDPAAEPVFTKALDNWYKAMPAIPEIQKSFGHIFNTTYWAGWPTTDNLYQVPNNWWGQFMFVIGSLKPTGKK